MHFFIIFSIIGFIIAFITFINYNKSIIHKLIAIELMLLCTTLVFIFSSYLIDDILGNSFAIFIISIAGAESAICLAFIISYFRFYYILDNIYYYSYNFIFIRLFL